MSKVYINLISEDALSEAVLRKILNHFPQYAIGVSRISGGYGWIRKNICGLNKAAKGMPYLILTDLDQEECAPTMKRNWLDTPASHNLLFRIAVPQVESWVMACRQEFSKYSGVVADRIPEDVDSIKNAKDYLLRIVKRFGKKALKMDLVPSEGSTAKVGPDYNGRLVDFVQRYWEPQIAKKHSNSLCRAFHAIEHYQPKL